MPTRREELRKRQRRILVWSMVAAAALHVVAFVFVPAFHAAPLSGSDMEVDSLATPKGANALAEVFFSPPTLFTDGGGAWVAPPKRTLAAQRGVRLEGGCKRLIGARALAHTGAVRLRVRDSGLVDVLGIDRSTGNACVDDVIREVAGALRYHWLPDERFPAPVELTQPVTLTGVK